MKPIHTPQISRQHKKQAPEEKTARIETDKADLQGLEALKASGIKVENINEKDVNAVVKFLYETDNINVVKSIIENTEPKNLGAVLKTFQDIPALLKLSTLNAALKSNFYNNDPVGTLIMISKSPMPRARKTLSNTDAITSPIPKPH